MRRVRYKDEGRVRVAHADLPVHFDQGFDGGENEAFCFDWSRPVRKLGQGVEPGPLHGAGTVETTACEVRGRFNNCDVYIMAPYSWIDPSTVAPDSDATVRLNLYVILQGTEYPVHDQTLVNPGTLPDLIVVRGTGGIGDTWRAYALRARGRPCDGFRVTVTVSQSTLVRVVLGQGQVSMFAFGEETASVDAGSIVVPADVTLTGPLPLPVSALPASNWAEQSGTAPDNTALPFVALAAAAASRYVEVSADSANTGTLYVARVALAAGASAGAAYELFGGAGVAGGDSVRIEIDNASKVFVGGSDGAQKYRVAVV